NEKPNGPTGRLDQGQQDDSPGTDEAESDAIVGFFSSEHQVQPSNGAVAAEDGGQTGERMLTGARSSWGQVCEQRCSAAPFRGEFKPRARALFHGVNEMSSGIKQLTPGAALWQGGTAKNSIERHVWIGPTRKTA